MTSLSEVHKQNSELADRINDEALANPQSPYAGKYVGIVSSKVVAVADTLGEVAQIVRPLDSDPARPFISVVECF